MSSQLQSIPMIILYLTSAFYHIPEFIDKFRPGYLEISDDKLTITNIKHCPLDQQGNYLHEWIPSATENIFTWTFLINKLKDKMYFGFVAKEEPNLHMDWWSWITKPAYSISNDCRVHKYNIKYGHTVYFRGSQPMKRLKGLVFGTGDKVLITLNLKDKTIHCSINGKEQILLTKKVNKSEDIKWKMCLSLEHPGDSVSILSFYQHQ